MRLPEEKALPFHDMGAYEKSTDVNQIAAVYKKYKENPETAYLGCSGSNVSREDDHRTAGRGNGWDCRKYGTGSNVGFTKR